MQRGQVGRKRGGEGKKVGTPRAKNTTTDARQLALAIEKG